MTILTAAPNMKTWSKEVISRALGVCVLCGSTYRVSPHHELRRAYKSVRLIVDNGVCLCAKCHSHVEDLKGENRVAYSKLSKLLVSPDVFDLLQDIVYYREHLSRR